MVKCTVHGVYNTFKCCGAIIISGISVNVDNYRSE